MMFGEYTAYILPAYGFAGFVILSLAAYCYWQNRRVRAHLAALETRDDT